LSLDALNMSTIGAVFMGSPLRLCILGSGLVALAAQLWLLAEALRRRSVCGDLRVLAEQGSWAGAAAAKVPHPILEVVALLALLMVPVATVASVGQARALMASAFSGANAAERARLLSQGWQGQLSSVSLGVLLEELAGGVGVVALSLAFAARRQIAGLVRGARIAADDPREAAAWANVPSPETLTVLACTGGLSLLVILPALQGALSYSTLLATQLAAMAAADPVERIQRTGDILRMAQDRLHSGIAASQLGLLLAAPSCAALLLWRSPARARRLWLGRPERPERDEAVGRLGGWGDAVWVTVALVVISATLSLIAIPLRAESQMSPSRPAQAQAPTPAQIQAQAQDR